MNVAAVPADENERIAALHDLQILDTPPEERFNRITRLAARVFSVPIALVSLVDTDRQWFKACYGLPISETSRDISFCAHAILQSQPLVVSDTLNDPRFADNPLVIHDPHIRFYAGQPLNSPFGKGLGTLCILDRSPRQMTEADLGALADLAAWAERELYSAELHKTLDLLRAANKQLESLNRTRGEFVHIVSHDFRTALTGIQGFSELIRDDNFGLNEIREYANDINMDAKRLNQMIEKLLEADRAAARKLSA